MPRSTNVANQASIEVTPTNITVSSGADLSGYVGYVTLYYTKTA